MLAAAGLHAQALHLQVEEPVRVPPHDQAVRVCANPRAPVGPAVSNGVALTHPGRDRVIKEASKTEPLVPRHIKMAASAGACPIDLQLQLHHPEDTLQLQAVLPPVTTVLLQVSGQWAARSMAWSAGSDSTCPARPRR